MNITRYDVPTEWYHITDIFSTPTCTQINLSSKQSLEIQGKRFHNTDSRTFVTIDSPNTTFACLKSNEWQMRKVFQKLQV